MAPRVEVGILIVEDEAVVGLDLQTRLEDLGYRAARWVTSASEARQAVTAGRPDLALVDIHIKGNDDGIRLAEDLRMRWGVPVVYITAYTDDRTLERARASRPYGYLVKPVQTRDLRIGIEMALARAEAERQVQASEALLEGVLRAVPAGIGVADAGLLLWVNDHLREMTGCPGGQLVGQSARVLYATDEEFGRVCALVQAQTGEQDAVTVETQWRAPGGGTNDVLLGVTRIGAGETRMAFAAVDLSEHKRLEALEEERRLWLVQADRLHSLDEMAAGMAHELNQPLSGIRALAEDLLIGSHQGVVLSPDGLRDTLRMIIGQVERITRTIDHMRALGYDSAEQEPVEFSLAEVVEGALTLVGTQLLLHGTAVQVTVAEELPACRGWPHQLEQALTNLLSNARDAVEARRQRVQREANIEPGTWQGRIAVTATSDGPRMEVAMRVTDNGGGLPEGLEGRIWEPFFTTKEAGRGTGLGLAIARRLVERNGGRIEVDNRPGDGVTFTVVMPAVCTAEYGAGG